ncbi:17522_t:CDS:1, partial [Racocetra persica]
NRKCEENEKEKKCHFFYDTSIIWKIMDEYDAKAQEFLDTYDAQKSKIQQC